MSFSLILILSYGEESKSDVSAESGACLSLFFYRFIESFAKEARILLRFVRDFTQRGCYLNVHVLLCSIIGCGGAADFENYFAGGRGCHNLLLATGRRNIRSVCQLVTAIPAAGFR